MNGPPTNIAAGDLWAQICAIPRPSRVADFPRLDPASGKPMGRIRFQVLTQEEQMLSSAAAEKTARGLLKDGPKGDGQDRGYADVFNNAACVEVLFRACKKEEDPNSSFFPTPQAIRQALTLDEVSVLFSQYLTVQVEVGPIVSKLGPEEVDAWVAKLTEGGSQLPLDFASWETAKTLALILACRLSALQTVTSSPGTPPENGEPPTDSNEAT